MKTIIRVLVVAVIVSMPLRTQVKTRGIRAEIKSLIIQSNKIKTVIYNTSSISRPGISANVLDLVWNGLGYGYEFGPLVGAKVPKAGSTSDTLKIVSEGFDAAADGEYSPDGTKWGWLPKAGYSAPGQPDIASWGARSKVGNDLRLRPPSWPESWFNPILGQYAYPSYLGGSSTVPDEEVYFVVDDWTKKEWPYYPFPDDSTKRGLGINMEVRTIQYAQSLAEDIIFLIYTVENPSPKRLDKLFFGMFGDPHIGGANNYADDAASFIPARQGTVFKNGMDLTMVNGVLTSGRSRNLVYAWDPDNRSDIATIAPGYFGYKFLESPSNSADGIDNDEDGLVDESPFNDKGVYLDNGNAARDIKDIAKYKAFYGNPKPHWSGDENGNWDVRNDDIGIDGIAGTGDEGEGNGVPDQKIGADGTWLGSEPNFGFRDVNESDQIGLNSFWALVFGGDNRPKNDILMYDKMSAMDSTALDLLTLPGGSTPVGDNIFLYGCGPFALRQGDRQRFSIALMMGSNLNDLLLNSETAQRVLEANYRFAQPPPKPHVTAVAGDKRVTLYWDTAAEAAVDPLTNQNDFEGYKIYRSEDVTFSDVFTITDGYGVPFLGKALYDPMAKRSALWHQSWNDSLKAVYAGGFHPVDYPGRFVKYFMGDPEDASGVRHQFVDSTVTNGKTYYYAVVAFDHGALTNSWKLPPTETTAMISRDAMTQEYRYDVNTISAVPRAGANADTSQINGAVTLTHTRGNATGSIRFQLLNPKEVQNSSFQISFKKIKSGTDSLMAYTILRTTQVIETIIGRDTIDVALKNKNIVKASLVVLAPGNIPVLPNMIVVDSAEGRIRGAAPGVLKAQISYTVTYQYYPVVNSVSLNSQDNNAVFDGMRPFVQDDVLSLDSTRSGLLDGRSIAGVKAAIGRSSVGLTRLAPMDVKITFTKSLGDTTADGLYVAPVDSLKATTGGNMFVKVPFTVTNATDTTPLSFLIKDAGVRGRWDLGDEIVVLTPPPYSQTSANVMLSIYFTALPPGPGTPVPTIGAGTVFVARTKKPFNEVDAYMLTTKSVTSVETPAANVPQEFSLSQNFPNPFNPSTKIEYTLPISGRVRITVFNVLGQEVATLVNNLHPAGTHSVAFNAGGLASGMYLYRIEAGPFVAVKKMLLLK